MSNNQQGTHGDPIWRYITVGGEHDCWPWQGPRSTKGRPRYAHAGVDTTPRRYVWQLYFGPVPGGLGLQSLCATGTDCCNPGHHMPTALWNRVDVQGPDDCWNWLGALKDKQKLAYGGTGIPGLPTRAHIAAWVLENGPVPDGMQINHHCDNPLCCNPAHLYAGTHEQNMADKARRGRARTNPLRGSDNPGSKLTDQAVVDIRQRAAAGEPQKDLAAQYGVAGSTISKVVSRTRWAHV